MEVSMRRFSILAICAHRATFVLAALIFLIALAQDGFAQSERWLGTWKLNLASSTYTVGTTPKRGALTFQQEGANLIDTTEGIDALGRPTKGVLQHIYDGQPHPTTGLPDADASAYTRVNANTVIFTRLKTGKLVGIGTLVLSQDGRTITVTTRGVSSAGQPLNNIAVYEKQ
jgi:hypothetical protein